ncbi:TPA: hypothetical protein SMP68_002578 [Proteus mirabilis]|nr:hypothetical protein [Proteus mirabilis]
MSFQDLSPESQQMARETLAEILKLEREHAYDLCDDQTKYIARFVKDAFIELEKESTSQPGQFSYQKSNESTGNPPSGICVSNGGIGNS